MYKIVTTSNNEVISEYAPYDHEVNFREHMFIIYQNGIGLVGIYPIEHFYLIRE